MQLRACEFAVWLCNLLSNQVVVQGIFAYLCGYLFNYHPKLEKIGGLWFHKLIFPPLEPTHICASNLFYYITCNAYPLSVSLHMTLFSYLPISRKSYLYIFKNNLILKLLTLSLISCFYSHKMPLEINFLNTVGLLDKF